MKMKLAEKDAKSSDTNTRVFLRMKSSTVRNLDKGRKNLYNVIKSPKHTTIGVFRFTQEEAKMKIIERSTAELKPYAKNTKRHDEKQITAVANSIREFGFVQPIVIDKSGTIVIGHCRYEAAKKLGIDKVPCVIADDLTEQEIDALRLVDNKTNESHWDYDILGEEIGEIPDIDFTDYNFGDFELLMLQSDYEDEEIEENEETSTAEKPQTKVSGRIIIIMHGEDEEQYIRDLFGLTELKPAIKATELMKGERI